MGAARGLRRARAGGPAALARGAGSAHRPGTCGRRCGDALPHAAPRACAAAGIPEIATGASSTAADSCARSNSRVAACAGSSRSPCSRTRRWRDFRGCVTWASRRSARRCGASPTRSASRWSTPNCLPTTSLRALHSRSAAGRCGPGARCIVWPARRSSCRKSSCRRWSQSSTGGSMKFAVRPRGAADRGGRGNRRALPGASHLLCRAKLRRPRAGDGLGSEARSTDLLHEACGRRRCQWRAGSVSVADEQPAPRDRTRRRARTWRARHRREPGAGSRVRLRGRQRPDAPRPAACREERWRPLGRRERIRSLRACHGHPPRRGDRSSDERRDLAGSEWRVAPARGPLPR